GEPARVLGLGDQLRPVAAAQPEDGRRAEQLVAADRSLQLLERAQRSFRLRARDEDPDEVSEGRVAERAAALELSAQELLDVVPDPLQLGDVGGKLVLQPLRPGADPGQLCGAALGTERRRRLGVPAVVATEHVALVQHQRDVAVRAAAGDAAGAAMDGGGEAAPVEEQDRLAAALGELPELREQRRREWVARLPPQVDHPYRRQPAG